MLLDDQVTIVQLASYNFNLPELATFYYNPLQRTLTQPSSFVRLLSFVTSPTYFPDN